MWEQYLSGFARRRGHGQHGRGDRGRPERAVALRVRPGHERAVVGVRLDARRGGARRGARLGRGSGSARASARSARRRCWPARAPRRRSPARTRRTAASTSTSTRRRSTAPLQHDVGPGVPRHPGRALNAVWRGDQGRPGRAADGRVPGVPQPVGLQAAHVDAIPGLEILANDVRCTHAAAIAQIDPTSSSTCARAGSWSDRPGAS